MWTLTADSFKFPAGVSLNHDLVSDLVGVVSALGVFALVVLQDAVLLPFLDALPVSLERYVEEGISTKH